MRRYIEIVEGRLDELQTTMQGPPPPIVRPRRGDDGPKGGAYWIKGDEVIAATDHDLRLYTEPELFGTNWREVLSYLERKDRMDSTLYKQWLGLMRPNTIDLDEPGHDWRGYYASMSPSTRTYISKNPGPVQWVYGFLSDHGWARVYFAPSERVDIAVKAQYAKEAMQAVARRFPILQVDVVSLNGVFFKHDEHPGFGGPFNAALDYASGMYANDWYYTSVQRWDRDDFMARGLVATRRYKRTDSGRSLPAVFSIDGIYRSQDDVPVPAGAMLLRFHSSAIPDHVESNTQNRVRFLYSSKPFELPTDQFQAYDTDAQAWRPLE